MNLFSAKYIKFIESIKIGDIYKTKFNFVIEYFNVEDKYGLKPIHWACLSSNIEILEWMLEKKCDIETSSRNGWRPIHFAYFVGNEEMVQILIKKACELGCKTDNGETVLDVANGEFNHEIIDKILIENINLKVINKFNINFVNAQIGLSMGLKCGGDCNHNLCLRTLIRPEYYLDKVIKRDPSNKVVVIKDSHSERLFGIKIIDRRDYDEYENRKCIGPKINEILQNINHSKMLKCYGLIKTEGKMILFTEWIKKRLLKNNIPITPMNNADIYRYCKDILQAVAFLHDNKILHRFINPATNIFIDNNGGFKLAISYFSYSLADGDVQIDDEWLSKYLQYSFAAPELVNNGILSYPYDIWLLGCTVIEMFTGNRLNYQSNKFDEFEKIILEIPNKMLQSFIRNMVIEISTARATANELLNHEFIKNVSIDNIENI